jgi:hypothetical protein
MRMTWRPGREGPTLYAYPERAPARDGAAECGAANAPPISATDATCSKGFDGSEATERPIDASAQIINASTAGVAENEPKPALMFYLQDRAKFRMEFLPSSDG